MNKKHKIEKRTSEYKVKKNDYVGLIEPKKSMKKIR
jgi:hypothetical protein